MDSVAAEKNAWGYHSGILCAEIIFFVGLSYLKEGLTVTGLLLLILMIETALERIRWHTKRIIINVCFDSFGNFQTPCDLVKYQ